MEEDSVWRGGVDPKEPSDTKKLYLIPRTSEWRTNFPSIRYKNSYTEFSEFETSVKETIYWASSVDSTIMPVVFENYDQQRMMYVGFYNGMSYFTVDRVFDQEYFEENIQ